MKQSVQTKTALALFSIETIPSCFETYLLLQLTRVEESPPAKKKPERQKKKDESDKEKEEEEGEVRFFFFYSASIL